MSAATRLTNHLRWPLQLCAAWLLRADFLLWTSGAMALLVLAANPLLSESIVLNWATVDFTFPLDTSLRWIYGHWPHRDYQTPVGIAYWLNQGIATALLGPSARAIFLANLIAASVIGSAGYLVTRRRLVRGPAAVLIIGISALILSPRMFGDTWMHISYLAPYNKIGMAILGIVIVIFFVEPRARITRRTELTDTLVVGFFLVWLIYLKLSFAIVAIAGGMVATYFAPANRGLTIRAIIIATVASVTIALATGLGGEYLRDIRSVAAVSQVLRPAKLIDDLVASFFSLTCLAISLVAYWRTSHISTKKRMANVVVAAGLMTAGVIAMNQVHGNASPLAFVALLVLAARALRESDRRNTLTLPPYCLPLLFAFLIVSQSIYQDVRAAQLSLKYQFSGRAVRICDAPSVPACDIAYAYFGSHAQTILRPFPLLLPRAKSANTAEIQAAARGTQTIAEHLAACGGEENCAMWRLYHELFGLLNLTMSQQDRPFMLGFMNPIPYYYGIEPPKHVPAWIHVGRTLSKDVRPEAEVLFSDVSLLVVPKTNLIQDWAPGLFDMYRADIHRLFTLVAETEGWSIWNKPIGSNG